MKHAAQYSVLGALTADAACLGLHWLYDTQRLAEGVAANGRAEFVEPKSENYEGYFGYFAHGSRRSGDLSHYGESALVMLRSLAESGGQFAMRHYENAFRTHFGPGGEFHGYIDNATRVTLENLAERDRRALEQATALVKDLPQDVRKTLVAKVVPYTRQFSGEALLVPVERAVRINYDDDALVKLAQEMALAIDRASAPCGADDDQVSGTAKLPALIARYAGQSELLPQVEAAVRVTNNNHAALVSACIVARLIEAAILDSAVEDAIAAGLAAATAADRERLKKAIAEPKDDPVAVVEQLGQTCFVSEAVPTVFYILSHWTNFTEAVRVNIRVGGDSCGRAIILGAVLGAARGIGSSDGIPLRWLLRVPHNREAAELLHRIGG